MTDPAGAGPAAESDGRDDQHRRPLSRREIFGEVLPDVTSDEAGAPDDWPAEDPRDEWIRRQVPPHH